MDGWWSGGWFGWVGLVGLASERERPLVKVPFTLMTKNPANGRTEPHSMERTNGYGNSI